MRRFAGPSRHARARRPSAEFQLASTSDIVFLLLIFFLTTAIVVSPYGLPLVLPPAGETAIVVAQRNLAVVRLDEAGRAQAGGRERSADELTAWAAEVQAERPEIVFSIEVDAGCPYEGVVLAVDALRRADVSRIGFSLLGDA